MLRQTCVRIPMQTKRLHVLVTQTHQFIGRHNLRPKHYVGHLFIPHGYATIVCNELSLKYLPAHDFIGHSQISSFIT